MPEVYDAGTMDPDEVAFGQLAPDRCEVERNYEAATSCQVDAGITSGSRGNNFRQPLSIGFHPLMF